MSNGAVRLIRTTPSVNNSHAILIVALFLLPTIAPLVAVNAESRIESKDFEILDELSKVLEERNEVIDSNAIGQLASPMLEQLKLGIQNTSVADPLHDIEEALDEVSLVDTNAPQVIHPEPYILLTNESSRPPGEVRTIWTTLFNLTDYVIWTRYIDNDGNVVEKFQTITFTTTLLSFLDSETEAFLHQVDIDDDGDDDIQVGLSVDLNDLELDGSTLSAAAQLDYRITVLQSSLTDSDWDNLETLEVSLLKAFAYSEGILSEGESYVWVIDSKFTHTPYEFTLGVGLERFNFDISGVAGEFLSSITTLILGLGLGDDNSVTIASIASPYQVSIENQGQTDCPNDYSPIELTTLPSSEIGCRVTAGFGYVHYSPPDSQDERDVWEVAYIEAAIHPNRLANILPSQVDVTIRTDSNIYL